MPVIYLGVISLDSEFQLSRSSNNSDMDKSFNSNFCHQEGSSTIFKYSVMLGWSIQFYIYLKNKYWYTSDDFDRIYWSSNMLPCPPSSLPYLIEIFITRCTADLYYTAVGLEKMWHSTDRQRNQLQRPL